MRIIVIFLLCVVGLVGLGMSLCGGAITLSGLAESGHGGGEFPASGFLVISVPSLIVGLALVVVAVGLVGLGMSLCGGAITLYGLAESGHGGGEFPASGFLVISVPSLRSLGRRLSAPPKPREENRDHPG